MQGDRGQQAQTSTRPWRSHGYESGLRPSRTKDQTAVATADGRQPGSRGRHVSRRRHSIAAPMPTSAPIAGASATV